MRGRNRWIAMLALAVMTATTAEAQTRRVLGRQIDSIVTSALAGGQAAGLAVAVVRGNDTLLLKGYGKIDLENDVASTPDAIFPIGSITKQFTAVAILQLMEQGKLDLNADLTTWFPASLTRGRKIPLRRLLDHTSGLDETNASSVGPGDPPRDAMVGAVSVAPFDFEPGEESSYNNTGYFLLGLVIEKVSGQSYAEYIKANLMDRAGMPNSHYCSDPSLAGRLARGYAANPQGLARVGEDATYKWPFAAGALCSTAGDMVAWLRALHGGRVLGESAYRELLTPGRLNDGTMTRYAGGLNLVPLDGHGQIAHGGAVGGFTSFSAWYPGTSTQIVVLNNARGSVAPGEVGRSIAALVLGPGEPPPASVEYPGDLSALAGTYRGPGRGQPLEFTLAVEGEVLTLRNRTGSAIPLRYIGGDVFIEGSARYTILRSGEEIRVRADRGAAVAVTTRQEP